MHISYCPEEGKLHFGERTLRKSAEKITSRAEADFESAEVLDAADVNKALIEVSKAAFTPAVKCRGDVASHVAKEILAEAIRLMS